MPFSYILPRGDRDGGRRVCAFKWEASATTAIAQWPGDLDTSKKTIEASFNNNDCTRHDEIFNDEVVGTVLIRRFGNFYVLYQKTCGPRRNKSHIWIFHVGAIIHTPHGWHYDQSPEDIRPY